MSLVLDIKYIWIIMNNILIGFYIGSLFMVILYNFQWYLSNKKIAYLYYSFLQFFMILFILQKYQIIFLNTACLIITAILAIIFALLFSKEFLELKTYYKNIYTFVNIIIFIIVGITIISLYFKNYEIFQQAYSILFFPFIPISYLIYKKGFKPALYYVLAWSVFVFSIFISDIIKIFDILHLDNFPFLYIGNFVQALILSFALSYKTKILIKEKKVQEQILIHQSRLASMGEMLSNISHQYRQPLNRIASFIMNMQLHIMDHYKKEDFLLGKLDEAQFQLEYLSHTIDDFSNFYTQDKEKQTFLISTVISHSNKIISSSLDSSYITLDIKILQDYSLYSYPKELAQVLLNILQNAKEALLEKKIKDPKIDILLNKNILSIQDNAKGIDLKIIDKIFDSYVTSKTKNNGNGIGLYMSKMILNKNFSANIDAKNSKNGAVFIITFN